MHPILFEVPGMGYRITGYGLMFLLACSGALWLTAWRAKREGLDPEAVYELAIWIFCGGVVGARTVYVIQNPGEMKSVADIFKVWQGGIVFYGCIFGGLIGTAIAWYRKPFPFLKMADAVAPALAWGAGIGRLGCFLNGCCYGDSCQLPWAVSFPRLSPPWSHHYALGLIGPNAPYSLPVHPTQLYSAVDAFILFLLLSAYFPLRKRDGEVMGLLVICYPITRFLIEILRNDEGVFILGLTISQTISVSLFATGLLYWAWLSRLPKTLYRDQAPAPEPHAPLVASAQP